MYKAFIRPLFFLINPEISHHIVVFLIKCVTAIPGGRVLLSYIFKTSVTASSVTVAGLNFKNRVGLAAGFDKNAEYFSDFEVFGFSFIEVGTVTPLAQSGNPKPRLFRLPMDKALVNRMGFNNKGIAHAVKKLKHRRDSLIIGGNIGKNTLTDNNRAVNDYLICFRELYDYVDYLVVNVSCPNIAELDKLQDYDSLGLIISKLMEERALRNDIKPVFLKISPDLDLKQIDETIELIRKTKLDGVIVANTTKTRNNLHSNSKMIEEIGQGGLSGVPLKNKTIEMISYICKHTDNDLPVIGSGGIMRGEDAIDMIKAGASLVQVYTGFIYEGPFIVKNINKAVENYLINPINEVKIQSS